MTGKQRFEKIKDDYEKVFFSINKKRVFISYINGWVHINNGVYRNKYRISQFEKAYAVLKNRLDNN